MIQARDKKFQNAGDGHGEDHAGQAGKVASEQHDNQCLQNVESQRFTDQCGVQEELFNDGVHHEVHAHQCEAEVEAGVAGYQAHADG